MKTFLINYKLYTHYRNTHHFSSGASFKVEQKTMFVEAEDESKASETLDKYWKKHTEKYEDSYTAEDVEVIQTIKQSELLW